MIVSSSAIVLNSIKYGDSSKIITVFTKEFGKVSLIAKGVRTAKSKTGSALELLNHINISFYKKPQVGLQLLSKAELIKTSTRIADSLECLSVGLANIESVNHSMQENDCHDELFEALAESMDLLNNYPKEPFFLFVKFQLILAKSLGFEPDFSSLESFVPKDIVSFNTENSTIVNGRYNGKNIFTIDTSIVKDLQLIDSCDFQQLSTLELNKCDSESKNKIIEFFVRYFSFHLDKHFYYKAFSIFEI